LCEPPVHREGNPRVELATGCESDLRYKRHDVPLTDRQQTLVEVEPALVGRFFETAPIQLRRLKRGDARGVRNGQRVLRITKAREVSEFLPSTLAHLRSQLRLEVAEIGERLTGVPFLPHE